MFGNNVAGVIDNRKVGSAVFAWKRETKNNVAGMIGQREKMGPLCLFGRQRLRIILRVN